MKKEICSIKTSFWDNVDAYSKDEAEPYGVSVVCCP